MWLFQLGSFHCDTCLAGSIHRCKQQNTYTTRALLAQLFLCQMFQLVSTVLLLFLLSCSCCTARLLTPPSLSLSWARHNGLLSLQFLKTPEYRISSNAYFCRKVYASYPLSLQRSTKSLHFISFYRESVRACKENLLWYQYEMRMKVKKKSESWALESPKTIILLKGGIK